MVWSRQWSMIVDGDGAKQLNSLASGGPYTTMCPELDWEHEQTAKFVPIDGDYPAYVGMQPAEGNYTLLIQMTACSESVYDTRLAQLKAWLTPGEHTLTFQYRGMPAAKTVKVVRRGISTDFQARRVTVLTTARKPVPV